MGSKYCPLMTEATGLAPSSIYMLCQYLIYKLLPACRAMNPFEKKYKQANDTQIHMFFGGLFVIVQDFKVMAYFQRT